MEYILSPEEIKEKSIEEINAVVTKQYQKAIEILGGSMDKLTIVANELFHNEKIDGERFREIMAQDREMTAQNN